MCIVTNFFKKKLFTSAYELSKNSSVFIMRYIEWQFEHSTSASKEFRSSCRIYCLKTDSGGRFLVRYGQYAVHFHK